MVAAKASTAAATSRNPRMFHSLIVLIVIQLTFHPTRFDFNTRSVSFSSRLTRARWQYFDLGQVFDVILSQQSTVAHFFSAAANTFLHAAVSLSPDLERHPTILPPPLLTPFQN